MELKLPPKRIQTVYPTDQAVIANIVLTDEPYCADPLGVRDCADAIQAALDAVNEIGGGTVFLPVGRYRMTHGVHVHVGCALIGDWQDPRSGNDYGTVILADVPSTADLFPALFDLGPSAGVMGLTVYYPEQMLAQTLTEVKPYPFVFYCGGGMLASVQNCTVLNGYRGMGACCGDTGPAHEQFTVDGLYGTFLCEGAEVYDQSDVGTWKNVSVSPRYWAEAGEAYGAPAYEDIRVYMKKHTIGLKLGDLEWTEFAWLEIEGCAIGMQIVKGHRIEFAGSVYAVTIRDCGVGLQVDHIDDRWGMVIASGTIEGDSYAILHNALGAVKMTAVQTVGQIGGSGEVIVRPEPIPADLLRPAPRRPLPADVLYVAHSEEGDLTEVLPGLLAEAGKTGGVVAIPAGIYWLRKPIRVPAGVELRGAASLPMRGPAGHGRGTLLMTDLDGDADSEALMTLAGKGATVSGVQFACPTNGPLNVHKTPFAIRGEAEEVACINCCIVAFSYGVDFTGCDRHFIKKLVSGCWENAMKLGGEDGYVEGCLQNGTVITRVAIPDTVGWVDESMIFHKLFPVTRLGAAPLADHEIPRRPEGPPPPPPKDENGNPIPREKRKGPPPRRFFHPGMMAPKEPIPLADRRGCTYLHICGAKGETVLNTFAYGVGGLVLTEGSENVFLCNLGSDNIAHPQQTVRNSSLFGVNLMRYNGFSYDIEGGHVSLYNRLTILDKHEANF